MPPTESDSLTPLISVSAQIHPLKYLSRFWISLHTFPPSIYWTLRLLWDAVLEVIGADQIDESLRALHETVVFSANPLSASGSPSCQKIITNAWILYAWKSKDSELICTETFWCLDMDSLLRPPPGMFHLQDICSCLMWNLKYCTIPLHSQGKHSTSPPRPPEADVWKVSAGDDPGKILFFLCICCITLSLVWLT